MASFAMSSREIERAISLCSSAAAAGFMEAKSVHADRPARLSDVIDKRPGVCAGDPRHAVESAREDGAGVLAGDVSAREHKCSDSCGLQSELFESAIADALVARQNNPAVLPRFGKPDFVFCTLGEVIGRALDLGARLAQRGHHGQIIERLVEKESERLRRL